MKINEIERIVGITKKNIRYYEAEGLLTPSRNGDNGYRDYDESDVENLYRIKLLRKLSVPISEIRAMQQGRFSVSDGARRHIITLDHDMENLKAARAVSERLGQGNETFAGFDAKTYLTEIDEMEKTGTSFVDVERTDMKRKRKSGAVIAGCVFIAIMLTMLGLFVYLLVSESAPWPVLVIMIVVPVATIIAVVIALKQRIKEIQGGEEDAAGQY